jgi:hypothetical protein
MGHRFYGSVEGRYTGDDLLEARRSVLDHWARHCAGEDDSAAGIPQRPA